MIDSYKKYTDAELISLLGKRKTESKAFEEIYNRYCSMLSAYSKCLIKDKDIADDIFQESFIRLHKSLKNKQDDQNIPGLLVTTCRNLAYNHTRDKKNIIEPEKANLISNENSNYENKELMELIIVAVEFLDEIYRKAFILREFDGLPYKKIAEIEGINLGNAKLRVSRAKKQVIEILQPYIKDIERS
jgi:RNA polymerase sigma-70 factor (ECF subfamily)